MTLATKGIAFYANYRRGGVDPPVERIFSAGRFGKRDFSLRSTATGIRVKVKLREIPASGTVGMARNRSVFRQWIFKRPDGAILQLFRARVISFSPIKVTKRGASVTLQIEAVPDMSIKTEAARIGAARIGKWVLVSPPADLHATPRETSSVSSA